MIALILISALLLLLLWILLVPVMVRVDTDYNRYAVTLPGIFNAYVIPGDSLFHIRLWIFFIPLRIDPFKPRQKKVQGEGTKKKPKKRRRFRGNPLKMLKAIRVKRFDVDLDTDDFILNAWLIPAFTAINTRAGTNMRVNFEGNLSLGLEIRTRLAYLIWLFIKHR